MDSSADRPHRLIGDFDFVYITFADPLQCRVKLSTDDCGRLVVTALLDRFPNAKNRPHAMIDNRRNLARDQIVALMKNMAPLGMAENNKVAADLPQHRRTDLACESAAVLPVAVLRGNFDFAPASCFLNR